VVFSTGLGVPPAQVPMTAPVPAASDEQSPAPQDTPAPEAADGAAEAVVES